MVIIKKWDLINKEVLAIIKNNNIEVMKLRSPLTCTTVSWVCQKCYGIDLSTRRKVDIGVPIWIIAAQSIGEPATQLTMKTFHQWWVAGQVDTSQGIERIKQLFEVRKPKNPAVIAPFDWKVSFSEKGAVRYINISSDYKKQNYVMKSWYKATVKKWDVLKKWVEYAAKGKSKLKIKEWGKVLEWL